MDTSAKHVVNVAARIFLWLIGAAFTFLAVAVTMVQLASAQEDQGPPQGMGIVQTDPHVVIMCQAKDHSLYFFDSDSVVQRADVVGADGHQGIVAVSIDTAGKQHIITTGDKHPDKCVWLFKDGPY